MICVVPSIAMCGPVRGDQKIHGKQQFSRKTTHWTETTPGHPNYFSRPSAALKKCKNICAETLEEVLKVEMFVLPALM